MVSATKAVSARVRAPVTYAGSSYRLGKDERMHGLKWSPSEKAIARKAFDQALNHELQQLVREAKDRAAIISEASELWKLESWLTERRREIDRKYDYRYSVLPLVFAELVKQGRIAENDLHGLAPEKIDVILGMASRL
jgi:hypothetical protein